MPQFISMTMPVCRVNFSYLSSETSSNPRRPLYLNGQEDCGSRPAPNRMEGSQEQPLVPPQFAHLKQLPLGTIKAPHVTHSGASPGK
jgi:hypothetical protein